MTWTVNSEVLKRFLLFYCNRVTNSNTAVVEKNMLSFYTVQFFSRKTDIQQQQQTYYFSNVRYISKAAFKSKQHSKGGKLFCTAIEKVRGIPGT